MKRTVALLVSAILFVSMLVLGVASKMQAQNTQDQGCSVATLQGTYGLIATGFAPATPTAGSPFHQVGTITFDGVEFAKGVFTFSSGGFIVTNFTFTAFYTVAQDCTGTITIPPGQPGAGAANIVIVAHGTQFLAIQTVPGTAVSGIAIKQ